MDGGLLGVVAGLMAGCRQARAARAVVAAYWACLAVYLGAQAVYLGRQVGHDGGGQGQGHGHGHGKGSAITAPLARRPWLPYLRAYGAEAAW